MLLRFATSLLVTAFTLVAAPALFATRDGSDAERPAKQTVAAHAYRWAAVATTGDGVELDSLDVAIANTLAPIDTFTPWFHRELPVELDRACRSVLEMAPKTSPPRA